MEWKGKKDELQGKIESGKSYEEIGREYGCSGANIKKVALRLGIILKQRRKINENETFNRGNRKTGICEYCGKEYYLYEEHRGHYCSHECYIKAKKENLIKNWKEGRHNGCDKRYKLTPTVRSYIIESRGSCCEKCGFSGTNPYTGKSILQIHHKDGNASNTSENNLEVLCPNCHAMTENFGSRNKSSVREYRKEEYRKNEDDIKKDPGSSTD